MSTADRQAARRLGLWLAVGIAMFCDVIALALFAGRGMDSVGYGDPGPDALPSLIVVILGGCVPIAAAAPFGWGLAPRLVRARLRGKIGTAILMAAGAVLLGDLLLSIGLAAANGAAWFPLFVVLGALFYGPFVFLLVTLPAAAAWVCLFRVASRSVRSRLDESPG